MKAVISLIQPLFRAMTEIRETFSLLFLKISDLYQSPKIVRWGSSQINSFFVDFLKSVRALLEKKESSKSQVFFTFEFSLCKLELVVSGLWGFMKKHFSNFSCRFLNPNNFFQFEL